MRAERQGKPMVLTVSAGQRHEQTQVVALLEEGAVRRPGRGRPRLRPERIAGDKGYSSGRVRGELARRRIRAVVPRRKGEPPGRSFDRVTYRERNAVERLVNRLKQFRRVATRYEKRAANYLAMLTLAAILLWL